MNEHLLLVDDDDAFRDRLARALIHRGVACDSVGTSEQALELIRTTPFTGAIIDLRMPGKSGLELVPELLQQQPHLSIVLLTGYGSIPTALQAVRLGARDFLLKPTDPETVLAAVRGVKFVRDSVPAPPEIPSLDRVEWEHIHRVLAETGGNISRTAQLLGIDRRSLQRKLGKYSPSR